MGGNSGGSAVSGDGDGLGGGVSPDISGGEEAFEVGPHPGIGMDSPVMIQRNQVAEKLGVRGPADIHEQASKIHLGCFATRYVPNLHRGDGAFTTTSSGRR